MINLNFCAPKMVCCLPLFIAILLHYHCVITAAAVPVPRLVPPVCTACNDTTLGGAADYEVCLFDERDNCIRRYASKCHLKFAACTSHKKLTDYSAEYCAMRGFICAEVEGFERWTIFFGHEKD